MKDNENANFAENPIYLLILLVIKLKRYNKNLIPQKFEI